MLYVIIWTVSLTAALVLYFRQVYSRFNKSGVKSPAAVPLIGNMGLVKILLRIDHVVEDLDKYYKNCPEERFIGRYEFMRPIVMLRDLDLIKKVAVKDFEHFLDHRGFIDESVEPMFARNLFALKGQEWKDMRSTLSPAFTSSKIRLMVPFMEEVAIQVVKVLSKEILESDSSHIDVDCKDLTARFSNDVIATCAFGLKVDSYLDKDNKFFEMGKTASTFKFKQLLLFLVYSASPALAKRLKLKFFTNDTKDFFLNLVLGTMKEREARNIVRPDMIHLLMQAKKGKLTHDDKDTGDAGYKDTGDAGFATVEESSLGKRHSDRVWSDIDLVAQAVLFFLAGFETVSLAMSFALHELAVHPEIQERLAQEIKENDAKNNGKLDYTSIQRMQYMDMVVSEVLRLWPPAIVLDRTCVKDYNLGKPNDKATEDYIVRKGDIVNIPTWCFHHDPQYYPDPKKFDPERFSEQNKHLLNPMAYMPFGVGPRNCIGSRFALCEMKVLLYMILLNMEVSPMEKTNVTSTLSKEFNLRLEGGYWLRFKQRS